MDNGADVNAVVENGWTPLHKAASIGEDAEIVKLFLENGANKDSHDNDGKTPLDLAIDDNQDGSHDEIIAILKK